MLKEEERDCLVYDLSSMVAVAAFDMDQSVMVLARLLELLVRANPVE